MRILYICSNFVPLWMGATRVTYDWARKLVEFGHEVHVLTRLYEGTPQHEVIEGIHITRIRPLIFCRAHTFTQYRLSLLSLFLFQCIQLIRELKRHKYDVIHATGNLSLLVGLVGKIFFRVPLVATVHSAESFYGYGRKSDPFLLKIAYKIDLSTFGCLKFGNKIVVPSHFMKKVLLGSLLWLDKTKIVIISNPVDTSQFKSRSECKGSKSVLFVGTLTEKKGVEILINAIPKILEKVSNAKFMIVGEGRRKKSLIKLAGSLGVRDKVSFVGAVDGYALPAYYRRADVLVLPSFFETFGIPLIEAMSTKIPVISTRLGGIPEIVKNGENGILVERGDVEALADAIGYLLLNPKIATGMGKRGREIVERDYSLDYIAKKLVLLYSEVNESSKTIGTTYVS